MNPQAVDAASKGSPMRIHTVFALVATVVALAAPSVSFAQSDASILTVSGRIGRTNSADHKSYTFSLAELQKLGEAHITSTTRYVGSTAEFIGPRIRDILKAVKAAPGATEISVVAIDGYQKTIPISDFTKWDVIMAHTQNGKRLTVETKGPLWIMYPNDKNADALLNNETTTKLVWSLTGFVVK
jgi:hypothetical protein